MRRSIYVVAVAAAVAAVLAIAWFLTPHATLRDLRDAARRHDAAGVAEYVDWPALRSYAADRAKSCVSELLGAPESGKAGAALRGVVSAISGVAIDSIVQQVVSPSVLTTFVSGERPGDQPTDVPGRASSDPFPEWSLEWQGWRRVNVRVRNGSSRLDRVLLSIRREGLEWRIDRVLFECPRVR